MLQTEKLEFTEKQQKQSHAIGTNNKISKVKRSSTLRKGGRTTGGGTLRSIS